MRFAITPAGYSLSPGSFTGQYLKPYLKKRRGRAQPGQGPKEGKAKKEAKPAKKKVPAKTNAKTKTKAKNKKT